MAVINMQRPAIWLLAAADRTAAFLRRKHCIEHRLRYAMRLLAVVLPMAPPAVRRMPQVLFRAVLPASCAHGTRPGLHPLPVRPAPGVPADPAVRVVTAVASLAALRAGLPEPILPAARFALGLNCPLAFR
jgi:hypothetical protein